MRTLEQKWARSLTPRQRTRELHAMVRFRDQEITRLEGQAKPVASGDVYRAFVRLAQGLDEKAKRLNGLADLLHGLRFIVQGEGDVNALRVLQDAIRELGKDSRLLSVTAWSHAKSFAHNDEDREIAGKIIEGELQHISRELGKGKSQGAA